MYVCMYVCKYVRMCVCMYVHMYVCMHAYMCIQTWEMLVRNPFICFTQNGKCLGHFDLKVYYAVSKAVFLLSAVPLEKQVHMYS